MTQAATGERPSLQELYDQSLAPYLAAEDVPVLRARRNRWIYSGIGLALGAAIIAWAFRAQLDTEYVPLAGFVIVVGSAFYFFLVTGVLSDEIRGHLMARLAAWMGLEYEARGAGFDLDRFALFALNDCKNVSRQDRLYGIAGGLAIDAVWAHLTDETTELGVDNQRSRRTIERFSGLLARVTDPAPPGITFRLVPPKADAQGLLRGTGRIIQLAGLTPAEIAAAKAVPGPETAVPHQTSDAEFDGRFELHALAPDLPMALDRLDAGTRAALLDLAGQFGGGPVAIGFDRGDMLLAFVTKRRFEIGPLKPPMADFERVQHLADQMGILAVIGETLAKARPTAAYAIVPMPAQG